MSESAQSRENGLKWIAAAILVAWSALIALGYFARLSYGQEDDEFQHLHMAWRIGQGEVPYRDFFELHPPLWHMVMAPIVRDLTSFAHAPFVELRAVHAMAIALMLLASHAILRRLMPPAPAALGAGLFLISSAFSFAWFDIRPDWIALLCLLIAVVLITSRSVNPRSQLLRFAAAGIIAGVACTMTQKSWFIVLGFLLWLIATTIFAPSTDTRRTRLARAGAFIAAGAAVGCVLLGYFALRDSAGHLVNDTLLVHIGAPRERWFAGYFRASAAPGAGLLAMGAIAMAITFRRFHAELRYAGPRGLLATLGLIGGIAYLITPAPFEQSYLFLICIWQSLLAAVLIWDVVREPSDARARRVVLIASIALVVLLAVGQKTTHDRIVVGASWLAALLMAAVVSTILLQHAARVRATAVLLVFSAIGIAFVVHDNVNALRFDDRAQRQARMYEALESQLAPGEPIIAMWPPALPFRNHTGTFPFAHHTILELFGPQVEAEYLAAIDRGDVNVVFGYMPVFAQWLPEFDRVLKRQFRPLSESPTIYDESCQTWVRIEGEVARSRAAGKKDGVVVEADVP
ncbi:MAG: hypothetical protein H7Z14_06915 [Anaerolineae bacterium]|nr:hypothetical protein [Phycisphaerae bacterium]